ncbi:MAG: response regulator [Desulfobacteraceae bacterium]|nr:response regulator [Desulfobacteraceae bacterium]MBU4055002.1 response regulator [Pseudomonadota bacterium]
MIFTSNDSPQNVKGWAQAMAFSRQILVVDDDELIQTMLAHIINNLGHSVFLVNNGHEGIHALRYRPFDLIITDLEMPKMDGIGLVSAVRTQSIQTPVILMTGSAREDVMRRASKVRIDHILFKPFHLTEVKSVINKLLNPNVEQ